MRGTLLLNSYTGSRLYGTQHDASDWDRRLVFIMPYQELCLSGLEAPVLHHKVPGEDTTYTELGAYLKEMLSGSPMAMEYTMNPGVQMTFAPRTNFYEWFWSKQTIRKHIAIAAAWMCMMGGDAPKSRSNAIRLLMTLRRYMTTGVYNPVLSAGEVADVKAIRLSEMPLEEVKGMRLRMTQELYNWLEHAELQDAPRVQVVRDYLVAQRVAYK